MTTAAALAGTVSWGSAIEVPGTAALNVGGNAEVTSVSCTGAGNCTAGGAYEDASNGYQAFVVSEQGGVWGTAINVPGMAALSGGNPSAVYSVSCSSPGNCAAGGLYDGADPHYGLQAFVVSERDGVWGRATEVPGTAAANVGGDARVTSVSCAGTGNCSAGGYYSAGEDKYGDPIDYQSFVVSEKSGKWGTAFNLKPLAAHVRFSDLTSVSCGGVGACVAGGEYTGKNGAFLAMETNGNWHRWRNVPGLAALSAGGAAWVNSVSCASPGNCTAVGWYQHGSGRYYAFVVAETNGKWGMAINVPGVAALNVGRGAGKSSVSCPSAGNCAVGGSYIDRANKTQAFVVGEKNGKWHKAIEVPGLAALNVGGSAGVNSVSCASAGNCAAVGSYSAGRAADGATDFHTFVVAERNRVWGTAVKVPGTETLGGTAWEFPTSVSCARAGNCAIGGSYGDGSGHDQAFVTAP